ncbi:uncharacterized protein A4U43_C04F34390 [Asparagus officinalis]|uniref:Uncharacterized protein n=1 Tax=Asparagus officinalis TaxID=4686 RepID=A0A5P1F7J3_ASPOF|nr:uncharacterized protein A4U43_C04F34390 [Asparagus officinalis]
MPMTGHEGRPGGALAKTGADVTKMEPAEEETQTVWISVKRTCIGCRRLRFRQGRDECVFIGRNHVLRCNESVVKEVMTSLRAHGMFLNRVVLAIIAFHTC